MFKYKNSKKGQGLPLNTIVIAILVIIVLVVVIMMFSGSVGESGETFSACETKGGICVNSCGGDSISLHSECPEDGDVCCSKPIGKSYEVEYGEVE